MAQVSENEIVEVVIDILNNMPHGKATIKQLIKEIPARVTLSAEDLEQSPTRPNESVWEQRVRNITSHKKSPSNAIYQGRLVHIRGGLALPLTALAA